MDSLEMSSTARDKAYCIGDLQDDPVTNNSDLDSSLAILQ